MGQNSGIIIRPMEALDVSALVPLHAEVFQGYNSTIMGAGYLRNLYQTLACHTACISIVALDRGKIVGWIGGVWDWLSFQRALAWRNITGAPVIFLSLLKNRPRLLAKVFSSFLTVVLELVQRFEVRKVDSSKPAISLQTALLVIGVDPKYQKRGVSQSMMENFDRLLLSRGFTGISVSTSANNEAGNRAFQKAGYTLYRTDDGINYYSKGLA